MATVGKSIPHESATGHVTGSALFIDDMPRLERELVVGFVGSPVAHGIIKNIDFAAALNLAGVVVIYTAKDIPGENLFGPVIKDEVFLADKEVHFKHEPILVIAAENMSTLKRAQKMVKLEVEELEAIFTIEQALEKKKFLGQVRTIARGDIEKSFVEAQHLLEDTFISGGQEQFYLESQVSYAIPEEGKLVVHSSSQNPTEIQTMVATVMGLGQHEVVAICKRMGGAFGGKETQGVHPALMVSLVALKTGRAARCAYDKDTDMKVTGKRHPYRSDYKVAFNSEGLITAIKVETFSNGGATADLSTSVLERTMLHLDNCYYLENVEITATICKTNLPPNTAFRGFGGPQGVAIIENILEDIAFTLGKDAFDVKFLNLYGDEKSGRNTAPYGQIIRNNVVPDIFKQLEISADYRSRKSAIKQFNEKSKTHLKGISIVPIKFGISFTTKHLNQGNALVNIYTDGTVQVSTGGTEMGQGLYTKIQQIVADEFAIDFAQVRVMATSTEKNNNSSPTAASAGTDLNGNAAVVACKKIRTRIAKFAAEYFSDADSGLIASPTDIVFNNNMLFDRRKPEEKISFKEMVYLVYRNRISLGERGFYVTPGVDFNRDTGKGNPFFYFTNAAMIAEVFIDRFTGEVKLTRADALMDFGSSINPKLDIGQATGGIVQGIGWVTNEELRYDDKGNLLSYSPTTYKIPNIQDIPEKFTVELFDNPHHVINVRRSKAVAEPPLVLGLSVFYAVKNALTYLSSDSLIRLNLPATSEEVLKRIESLTTEKVFHPNEDPATEQEIAIVG